MTSNGGSKAADEARQLERRREMVARQLASRDIHDPRVLRAMETVPRHRFVPDEYLDRAYADEPLPIGEGQTISQPYMVAAMAQALELAEGEKVLEVGAGSGYQAAVLAQLAREVIAVESRAALAESARARLAALGYANVRIEVGDGTLGWPAVAPYDAILVAAAAPRIPPPLIEQLGEGGRLVIPVGAPDQQELIQARKRSGRLEQRTVNYCRFVPLVGRHGWEGKHR